MSKMSESGNYDLFTSTCSYSFHKTERQNKNHGGNMEIFFAYYKWFLFQTHFQVLEIQWQYKRYLFQRVWRINEAKKSCYNTYTIQYIYSYNFAQGEGATLRFQNPWVGPLLFKTPLEIFFILQFI